MLNSNEVLKGNFASKRRYSADHNGIDYPCPTGTPCIARFNGVVTRNGTNKPAQDFGNYVIVAYDGNGLQGWYAHLSAFAVPVGTRVTKGQVIGYSGNSGYVIPPAPAGQHLHYSESRTNTITWVNPDLTQTGGGDVVTTTDLLNAYFIDLLGRMPDAGAYATYVGKHPQDVYHAIRTSQERANRVKTQEAELQTAKDQAAKVPGLETQVNQLTQDLATANAQLDQANKALVALRIEVEKQAEEIADLTKKLQDCTSQAPTPPSIEDMIKAIILWIKGIVGGGEK